MEKRRDAGRTGSAPMALSSEETDWEFQWASKRQQLCEATEED